MYLLISKTNKILLLLLIIGNVILWPVIIQQLNQNNTETTPTNDTPSITKSNYEQLMSSLMDDNVPDVKRILKVKNVDISQENKNGDRPILWAAHFSPASVPLLLEKGADPNFTTLNEGQDGITPISIAAANDGWKEEYYPAAISLLKHGANPKTPNVHGITPLMAAAKFDGSKEMVQLLLDHGANPLCKDLRNETAKDKAVSVRRDDRKKIIALLDREMKRGKYNVANCAEVNSTASSPEDKLKELGYYLGEDEFLYAIDTNDTYAVKQYLALGYDPNVTRSDGERILNDLYWSEQYNMIKLLVEGGAAPDVTDIMGMTPLIRAAEDGRVDLVKTLISNGADPNLENNAGWNAIRFARAENQYEVLEIINNYQQQDKNVSIETMEHPPEFTVTVHEKFKKQFYSADEAIKYAKQFDQAEIYNPTTTIWDNKPSSVYRGDKHLGDFPTKQKAIQFANQFEKVKVINIETGFVVYDTFPKECGTCDSPIQHQYGNYDIFE